MSDNIAIKVEKLSKTFHEQAGSKSFKEAFVNIGRKLTGKKEKKFHTGDFTALKDINFEVKKGEFFGIVGRNGSGKSTLLKILAGVYTPTTGAVTVSGNLTPFIELGVGFNPELSGRDNVFLNGALLGFTRKQMDEMYDDIVEFAELKDFMDTKLKNYSSGMQVRLAFSVAIRAESDILLIDEVLAVGDAEFQRKCYEYFMLLKRNKKTVVLVTHDMGAVRQYCDKALMINNGLVSKNGKPEYIAQAYQKMFSTEIDNTEEKENKEIDRWGNGKIKANKPTITISRDYVIIKSSFNSNENIDNPIFGFTIYSPSGINILEGNTKRMKYKTEKVAKGELLKFEWKIPNIFAQGNYSVSVACCDDSATNFFDWYNYSAKFIIHRDGNTAGLVDPELSLRKV